VAELPGQAYNPLFLYAPPGLGKTHLLHAIGNYVLAFAGGATVRYATVETFTNHFVSALGSTSLDRFKKAYRSADVLLVADAQVLELIAERVTNNVRTLEGALIRIVAHHSLSRRPIDVDLAESVLNGIASTTASRQTTVSAIQAAVAAYFGLTVSELTSSSR